ncbi:MAG: hypothetical protein NT082_02730 [Chloroflexi bacterium]|nr:hypothetical protein [Chloroflexota bacterium]
MKDVTGAVPPGLDAVMQVMSRTCGMDVSPYDQSFLAKTLERRLEATSIRTAAEYLEYLAENADEALEEISMTKGKLYDADAVDACLRLFKEQGFKFEE